MNDLASLAQLLEQSGVPYALIGGHAVNTWLAPRFTADVDVTVEADPAGLAHLHRILAGANLVQRGTFPPDLPSGPDLIRYASTDGVLSVELQTAKTGFQREVIRRARPIPGGFRVATPEDLIVFKLIANRPKDQIDLGGLIGLPNLDWSYVERWAAQWQVLDTLHQLRDG